MAMPGMNLTSSAELRPWTDSLSTISEFSVVLLDPLSMGMTAASEAVTSTTSMAAPATGSEMLGMVWLSPWCSMMPVCDHDSKPVALIWSL
jgi:hypothetical protein